MSGFARDIVFFRVNRASVAEKSWLAVALLSNLSRTARAVELMVPGDCSLLCWCCATAIIVFCMCCDTLCMGTGVSKRCVLQYCVAILLCCAIQFVQIAVAWLRQGCWNGTSSAVESCDSVCGLQVSVGRSHWNCYIMDAIWMLYARNIAFFRVNRASVAEKSWLAWATIAGDFSLTSNLSRTARAVELMVPGDFSLFGCCAFCVLHVLRHGVHGNWCIEAMYSTVLCCNSFVLCNSVCADRSGMASPRLLEWYLFCSTVEPCHSVCGLQVSVGRSHWNCYIMDAIWMLGFARNIVFSRVNRASVAEKSWLACATVAGRRCFAVESVSNCACSGTDGSRWLFRFFVDAVLLCFACVATRCALELVYRSDVFHSSVLQFLCVVQSSLCR